MIILEKVKKYFWDKLISFSKGKLFYPLLYKSYWFFLFNESKTRNFSKNYYTTIPNPGAGIGHQLANWIAGYWFAKQLKLQFAHSPFSNAKWEYFLGFGEQEKTLKELLSKGYRRVNLPLFNENKPIDIELQKKIIQSFGSKKVVFVAEQDQFYKNQFEVIDAIQNKFYNAPSRQQDKLIYDSDTFNIAVHVRRGDIVIGQESRNPNLLLRWQDNNYYVTVLKQALDKIVISKPIKIYLFSQGEVTDFPDFDEFPNLHFCLDMNAQDSFLHMVYADLLITSKSSFSYKPALLNKGLKICPKNFWHGYPDSKDWLFADNHGNLLINNIDE
ncbi:hypothetical protein PBAC_17030 [Pedobacter glucosidilyticus]|nr:hypothetical protein [Pedobacter glucosidilyticus]KHJ38162.1 hypothetical protein PBAC_17030 [Pedobacter glucosidilyticus]